MIIKKKMLLDICEKTSYIFIDIFIIYVFGAVGLD